MNPFGPFAFGIHNYPNDNKKYISFQKQCGNDKNSDNIKYSDKIIKKVRNEFEELCTNLPDNKLAAQCVMGNYFLHSDGSVDGLQEEGFKLLKDGISQFPDTTLVTGETRELQKLFIGTVYHQLACAYLMGIGTTSDYELAYYYYCKEMDYCGASRALPLCYILGIGTAINEELAKKAYGCFNSEMGYYYMKYQMFADLESLIEIPKWNQDHQIADSTFAYFREGYIKWHINKDFDGACDMFTNAINMGYTPAMCELAMLYLDERWSKNNEEQFVSWIHNAIEAGYVPACHIIGRRYAECWGVITPFSSSGEGKAYPYFYVSAKAGYKPSIDVIAEYDEGKYSKKTGLAAAFGDLDAGWRQGDKDGPGILEGLLMLGVAINNKISDISRGSRNTSTSTSPSTATTSSTSISTSSSSEFEPNLSTGMFAELSRQYREWEHRASKAMDTFNKHFGWLYAHSNSSDKYDYHIHMYSSAKKTLKSDLEALRNTRAAAAKEGFNIPMGMIEDAVEECLNKPDP